MPDIYEEIANWKPAVAPQASGQEAAPAQPSSSGDIYAEIANWKPQFSAPSEPTGLEPSIEDAQRRQLAGIRAGRTPEEHEKYLREAGYNDAAVKSLMQEYLPAYARRLERERIPEKQTTMGGILGEFVNPGSETWRESFRTGPARRIESFRSFWAGENTDYQRAVKNFQEGKGTLDDAKLIAKHERRQEVDRENQSSLPQAILAGLPAIPGMAGEALVGGQVLRGVGIGGRVAGQRLGLLSEPAAPLTGQALSNASASTIRAALADPSKLAALGTHAGRAALITPMMPSMYVEQAQRNNAEAGRDPNGPDAWKGYPGAMLSAYVNVAILGKLVERAGAGGNIAKATGLGMAEQQGADVLTGLMDDYLLPDAMKTKTKYGVMGHLMGLGGQKASTSEALKAATIQAVQFAAFAGMHAGQEIGKEIGEVEQTKIINQASRDLMGAYQKDLAALGESGLAADAAGKRMLSLQERLQAAINEASKYPMKLVTPEAKPTTEVSPELAASVEGKVALARAESDVRAGRVLMKPGEALGEPISAAEMLAKMKIPGTGKQSALAERMADVLKRSEKFAPVQKNGETEAEKPTDLAQTPPPRGEIAPEAISVAPERPAAEAAKTPPEPALTQPERTGEPAQPTEPVSDNVQAQRPPLERQKPALTPKMAKSYWTTLTARNRKALREDSPQAYAELTSAMRKGGYAPDKIKPAAEMRPTGEARVKRGSRIELDPESERVIDESSLPEDRKEALKAHMRGESLNEAADKADITGARLQQLGIKLFGESAYQRLMKVAEQNKIDMAARQAEQSAGGARVEQGINAGGGRRINKAAKDFMREEGGWYSVEWAEKLSNWFSWLAGTGKSKGKGPDVKLDNENVLPEPQENSEYKLIASEPATAGRIPVVGRILDPARSDTTPESKVLTARQALVDQGRNISRSWDSQRPAIEADSLFKTDPGKGAEAAEPYSLKAFFRGGKTTPADTSLRGTYVREDGSRGRIADDIEAHMRGEKTKLSEAQKAWVDNVWTPLLRSAQKLMARDGITSWMDEDGTVVGRNAKAYFPRQAIGKEGVDVEAGRDTMGKGRSYKSEADGAAEGVIYDPSARSRVSKFIASVYRAVADHRLANDAALGGETIDARYEKLKAENADRLAGLDGKAKEDVLKELHEQAATPGLSRAYVRNGPRSLAKYMFPVETAKKIENLYKQEDYKPIKTVEKISAAAKGITLGLDFGYTTIQLLPTMFTKPTAWAKANVAAMRAFFDPNYMASRLEVSPDDAKAVRELTQLGSSIGRLHDSMAGLQQGEFATRLPIVGKAYEAAGRAMGTALDVAKIELWKAWSKTAQPHELRALAESIDAMLLQGRMESIGLSPRRMMWERLLLNAPAYYRGGINFIAGAFQRGTPGTMMRTAMAATIGGIALTSFGAMLAAGLSQDEILERFNPARGKFLKVPIPLGDNKKIEVGYSNILTSYARLVGTSADYFASDKPINTGTDGNPILRWVRGKAAFSPRLLTDIVTGKDYLGNRVQAHEAIIKAFEPLAVQTLLHGEGSISEKGFGPKSPTQEPSRKNVADAIISVLGFSSYSGSKTDEKYAVLNDESQKRFGSGFDSLSVEKQIEVVKAAKNRPDMPPSEASSSTEMERAIALQAERKQKITSMVSKESRSKLSKLGKELPSYLGTLSVNNADLPLSRDRLGRYEKFLADEYNQAIETWNVSDMKSMEPIARERLMERTLMKAKDRAKRRLIAEWN